MAEDPIYDSKWAGYISFTNDQFISATATCFLNYDPVLDTYLDDVSRCSIDKFKYYQNVFYKDQCENYIKGEFNNGECKVLSVQKEAGLIECGGNGSYNKMLNRCICNKGFYLKEGSDTCIEIKENMDLCLGQIYKSEVGTKVIDYNYMGLNYTSKVWQGKNGWFFRLKTDYNIKIPLPECKQ